MNSLWTECAPVDQIIMKLSIFFPFSIHHGLNICGTIQRSNFSILTKCCVLPWKLTIKFICLHSDVIRRFVVRGFTSMKHPIRMFEWKENLWKTLSLNESFIVVRQKNIFFFSYALNVNLEINLEVNIQIGTADVHRIKRKKKKPRTCSKRCDKEICFCINSIECLHMQIKTKK